MSTPMPPRSRGRARQIHEPMVCDGKIGKPLWDRAERLAGFTEPWGKGGCPIEIEARVLWSDTGLYVRFVSGNAEIVASRTRRHADVCNDSCCEMFISPFFDHPERYFTFEINALGAMLNRKMNVAANPVLREPWFPLGMRIGHSVTGVAVDEPGPAEWVIELAVPWSQFTMDGVEYRPKAGDRWRVNFMRCGGRTLNPFLMWSPAAGPKPAFHQPQYFGELEFV